MVTRGFEFDWDGFVLTKGGLGSRRGARRRGPETKASGRVLEKENKMDVLLSYACVWVRKGSFLLTKGGLGAGGARESKSQGPERVVGL